MALRIAERTASVERSYEANGAAKDRGRFRITLGVRGARAHQPILAAATGPVPRRGTTTDGTR